MSAQTHAVRISALILCLATPLPLEAQGTITGIVLQSGTMRRVTHASPTPLLLLSFRMPTGKPALSVSGLLKQTASGSLIGSGGAMAAAVGILFAGLIAGGGDSLNEVEIPWPDRVSHLLIATGFTAGTVLGVYAAGEQQGMRGSPWATTAGTVGGLVAGVRIYDASQTGGTALLMMTLPAAAGTAGYALTRTAR
jgi:hypothetical protein